LDIALRKLVSGSAHELLAEERGLAVEERHRVLELIAEAERTTGLVEPASTPHPAGEHLVDQPAVREEVERRIRRLNVDRAERAIPIRPHRVQRDLSSAGSAEASDDVSGIGEIAPRSEQEHDLSLLV